MLVAKGSVEVTYEYLNLGEVWDCWVTAFAISLSLRMNCCLGIVLRRIMTWDFEGFEDMPVRSLLYISCLSSNTQDNFSCFRALDSR